MREGENIWKKCVAVISMLHFSSPHLKHNTQINCPCFFPYMCRISVSFKSNPVCLSVLFSDPPNYEGALPPLSPCYLQMIEDILSFKSNFANSMQFYTILPNICHQGLKASSHAWVSPNLL